MFEKVNTDQGALGREQEVLRFWQAEKVFARSVEQRKGAPEFIFYEGPPTANGKPHIGHILTRVIKDIIPRYQTMKGCQVRRKAGWDTHGLPVELEVEKELGIDGKQQIEAYGVEAFIQKCRESVWKYKTEWEEMSDRVGFWADMDDPYITYENDYIESEWWALKEIWNKGLIYKGHKTVPYCPRCGTALSSHEVAQGYQDVTDTSVFVRFRVAEAEDTWLAAWTTTPWTLPSNVGLCVNPVEEYVLAEVPPADAGNDGTKAAGEARPQRYWLAAALARQVFGEDIRILERKLGQELVGMRYEPLFPYARDVVAAQEPQGKKAWIVTADRFVTLEDGTGIVHMAPAFGEDDARVGRAYNLAFVQLVLPDGTMSPETEEFAGQFVKDADPGLIARLKTDGLLLSTVPYEHSYPFCWRCDTPLLYYARDTWFIRMTELRDNLLRNNQTVNWIPENIRDGRFGNFLENVVDWGISRERYWGTPLPIWECSCGHRHMVGSIAELRELSDDCPPEIELHKPYIDAVHIRCSECGGTMRRVSEVIDCWFDSGSMPFAQWHYPFENQELFNSHFPADFISEAIDQTRGWFYTLMAISTLLFDQAPYRNVIVLGHVQDKNGQKMSKHKGNVIAPEVVLSSQGADAVRWYFCVANSPWLPSRFSLEAVAEVQRKFLATYWNTYAFFVLYARIDGFDPKEHTAKKEYLTQLDRWILSRLNSLTALVRDRLDAYDITAAARAIQQFTEDLSNWYVRRSRERFWQNGMPEDKKAAYQTLYQALVVLTQLAAPFVPFQTEAIWRNLVAAQDAQAPQSVHLSDLPEADPTAIDRQLEARMAATLDVVTMGRAARNLAQIKNRQPLSRLLLVQPGEMPEVFDALIADELNIREIVRLEDAAMLTDYRFKPQLRTLGRRFGKQLGEVTAALATLDGRAAMRSLRDNGYLIITVDGQSERLEETDLLIEQVQPEGFAIVSEREITVALDTQLTPELIEEGFVREIISKVQNMRKDSGFDVLDRIILRHAGNKRIAEIMERNQAMIAGEVLAEQIMEGEGSAPRVWDLNGETCTLSVDRV